MAKLAITAPGFSLELGTPERKIVDAVAESISEAYIDQYLVGSLLDIESKAGLELEQFVGIFGFGRLQGRKATGVVRVELSTANEQDTPISIGTQFYTRQGLPGSNNPLFFSSTQAVVIPAGSYVTDIPVECTIVGTVGNLPPDSIVYLGQIIGATSVTNLTSMTGGVDVETDAELRQRFKDTFMRNIAGTEDWYLGLCYQNKNVSKAACFGPIRKYVTQIAVPNTTLTLPVTADVKYAWCTVPETRVLTESLDWVPVGDLRVGDKLIGFDEDQPPGMGKKRAWRQAEVTTTGIFDAPLLEVQTDRASVTCTGDHPFLVSRRGPLMSTRERGIVRGERALGRGQWVLAKDLVPGDKIRHIPMWKQDTSFEAGYVSGIFDGEGSSPRGPSNIEISQNPGLVFDRIMALLKEHHFDSLKIYDKSESKTSRSPNPRCKSIVVNGGVEEMLRFYGTFKPVRLLPKFLDKLYGTSILGGGRGVQRGTRHAEVSAVIPRGTGKVVALGTSTRTLVTEGLLSHNTDGESVFKNLGQEDEVFYRPVDDYTFTAGASPQITRVGTGAMVVGDIVDVEFEYTTECSRNDPEAGITNKVDVFVNGSDPYTITERTVVTSQTLSASSSVWNYTGHFARVGSTGSPSSANRFMRLGSVPIVSFPSTVTVGVTNYQQGTHYHVLRGTTLDAGSIREIAGIEWTVSGPANGVELTLNYVYNRVPEVLGAVVKANKQITTDVLVHQASYAYLRPHLNIEYDRGFVVTQVNTAIQDRLRAYFAGLPYGAWVEISDVSLAVHQVLGVDNVTLTTDTDDADDYGIKVYGASSDVTPLVIQTEDFKLGDNQLPIFLDAVIIRKANR